MKPAYGIKTTIAALAAALGLSLAGPHRAAAVPDSPIVLDNSSPVVTLLSPIPHATFTGDKPVEISCFYQGSAGNPVSGVELYVDGVKAATKAIDPPESRGVVSFLVDASALTQGTHRIVVRATAQDAQVTSAKGSFAYGAPSDSAEDTQRSALAAAASTLKIVDPSVDGKVEGTVTLHVKASSVDGKSPYVSFFVDHAFKTLKNYAPYEFEWDTTTLSNGFHTLQVMEAFDGADPASAAPTKTLRVFVNNPGGRTERRTDLTDTVPAAAVPTRAKSVYKKVAIARRRPSLPELVLPAEAAPPKAALPMTPALLAAEPIHIAPQKMHHSASVRLAKRWPIIDESRLSLAPGLANPFVADITPPVLHKTVRVHTPAVMPVRGFKILTAKHLAAGTPIMAMEALAPKPVTAKPLRTPLRMADIAIPLPHLMAPFLAAPHVKIVVETKKFAIASSAVPIIKRSATRMELHTASSASVNMLRSAGQTSVLFNSVKLQLERPLAAQGGMMFGPLRQIFEFEGGTLRWEAKTGTVRAKSETKDIRLIIGQKRATVNKQVVALDAAPYVSQGRTMIPLSFLPLAMDVNVKYDAANGHLLVTSKQ